MLIDPFPFVKGLKQDVLSLIQSSLAHEAQASFTQQNLRSRTAPGQDPLSKNAQRKYTLSGA